MLIFHDFWPCLGTDLDPNARPLVQNMASDPEETCRIFFFFFFPELFFFADVWPFWPVSRVPAVEFTIFHHLPMVDSTGLGAAISDAAFWRLSRQGCRNERYGSWYGYS